MWEKVFSKLKKIYLRFEIKKMAYFASVLCVFVSGMVSGSIKSDLGCF